MLVVVCPGAVWAGVSVMEPLFVIIDGPLRPAGSLTLPI